MMQRRILMAKPGLDGHDRGIKIVARILRDAGFEVILTGIRQTIDEIVEIALQEDVDAIGLSILSGAHLGLSRRLMDGLAAKGLSDIAVFVGGTIPSVDVPKLYALGVAAVFITGSTPEEIIEGVSSAIAERAS